LTRGIYFISLKSGHEVAAKRFVKL
jgi:hypothetical protein